MFSTKFKDLKYEDEKQTIGELLRKEKLPVTVRICQIESQTPQIDIPEDIEILFQKSSKETFAQIKVLKFHDNELMQRQKGAEYVLEHETFVGHEYLMPFGFPGNVKLVRRPGSRGRYLTIKQVIDDCPAIVKVEQDTEAYLSNNMKQKVTVHAFTILELKKIYENSSANDKLAELSAGTQSYTFSENDKVNFTAVERDILYSLSSLADIDLFPKVILFQGVKLHDIVLKDDTLRSGMCTIVEGPIELLGVVNIEYVTCWTRNKRLKTFETALIPRQLWNKIYVQKRCFYGGNDKEKHLTKKFGQCLRPQFVSKSLYLMKCSVSEVTWLRCPEFFKQHLEGNTLYEVIKLPFYDSSDDENIYQDIEEPVPQIPDRRKHGNAQEAVIKNRKESSENSPRANIEARVFPLQHSKSNDTVNTESTAMIEGNVKHDKTVHGVLRQRSLPFIPVEKNISRDNKYTKLEFTSSSRVYESLDVYGDSLPLGYSKNIPGKSHQYIELGQVKKILQENQTQEDFYNYSVKEVSFCFEHCGLKSLADICYEKKLDGSFFRGFSDWKELNLSSLDVIILKKMIFEGWRSKDDSTFAVSTHM